MVHGRIVKKFTIFSPIIYLLFVDGLWQNSRNIVHTDFFHADELHPLNRGNAQSAAINRNRNLIAPEGKPGFAGSCQLRVLKTEFQYLSRCVQGDAECGHRRLHSSLKGIGSEKYARSLQALIVNRGTI